uniref:Restriction endonuclease n=1 Tax=Candidatus Kentrum sp. TC TaxID=2126339 RepID=A0A450YK70_9GAMM|nr:MAG: Putative restriction endonuclease [Candidatus Kentron sp. TC]
MVVQRIEKLLGKRNLKKMSLSAEYPATYEDILCASPERTAQLIHGRLYTLPRPTMRHALAGSSLGAVIGHHYRRMGHNGYGGWWILYEPEIHLGDHVLVADWVCEILSPSNASLDRIVKMTLYAKFQVEHLWLLDPKLQTLEVFTRQKNKWLFCRAFQESDPVAAPPFDALRFDLGALWP